jgi:hypothetical protein
MATYPNTTSASDVWSLRDVYKAEAGDEWPFISTLGRDYVSSYLATTGGSLITVSSGGDLRAAIDGATDGDAILVNEGTYQLGPAVGSDTLHSGKDVLIAGNTDVPQNVVLDFDHDTNTDIRDHDVFSTSCSTTNCQIAFLTFFRNPTTTINTNYNSTILGGGNGTTKGIAVNVYFDLDDKLVAWHYDNNENTAHDVRFLRCTFANYSTWTTSYSGRNDVIDVGNCLFDDTTVTNEYVNLGDNVTSGTVDTGNRTYNTSTYPTAGHLYIPNTTAVF